MYSARVNACWRPSSVYCFGSVTVSSNYFLVHSSASPGRFVLPFPIRNSTILLIFGFPSFLQEFLHGFSDRGACLFSGFSLNLLKFLFVFVVEIHCSPFFSHLITFNKSESNGFKVCWRIMTYSLKRVRAKSPTIFE